MSRADWLIGELVLSGRMASGEKEPSYSKTVNVTSVQPVENDIPNGINDDGKFYQTGVCKACLKLTNSPIDLNSTQQQFIYALGPKGRDPYSSSLDAPLRRHIFHGHFGLDVSQAHGVSLPVFKFFATDKDDFEGGLSLDPDFAESAHAFAMLLTFVIIIPFGIFFIRTLEHIKVHMILQSIALILILIGFITGIVISKLYNRVCFASPPRWFDANYNLVYEI
jgi:hypothetical protein